MFVYSASHTFFSYLDDINENLKVFSKACPLFVPLAEEGWHSGEITRKIIETYLVDLLKKDIDVMILGCTHYPLLKSAIKDVVGDEILLVDSAEETAAEISSLVETDGHEGSPYIKNEYFLTDDSESFIRIAGKFLGKELEEVKLTDL